jgi:uroporphyrinogen decarboxylase
VNCFLKALEGKNQETVPVWFMRQAGRYLPTYQTIRRQHSLLDMFKTPKLASDITLLPFQDLELDAAIIFSDILVVFEALGFFVDYPLGKGPQISAPDDLDQILKQIKRHNLETCLNYVYESIQHVKPKLHVPLLGFSATPFTLLAYLLQKPMKEDIHQVKKALYEDSFKVKLLLEIFTDLLINHAQLQIIAGVDAYQLFDTASTWLSDEAFQEFSLPYTQKIVDRLSDLGVKTILFSKSTLSRMEHYNKLQINALSVDWTGSYTSLRQQLKPTISVQGNLDPFLTTLEFSKIEPELEKLLNQVQDSSNFIFNLGHGVLPQTRLDTLQGIIKYLKHDFSKKQALFN